MGKTTKQKQLDNTMETIATNMRSLRDAKGWTRRGLAQKSDVNEDVLQKIELQQRLPKVETLVLVALALDVNVAALFKGGKSL